VVAEKVELSHTDLTEVTRMVLVDVGTVVVLRNVSSFDFLLQNHHGNPLHT
jgi:hypothetical protein